MRLFIIRHGETEWNKVRRLQGQTDIPLNERGRELAGKVGEVLKSVPFTRVISSPLERAVMTAKLVVGERKIPFQTDPRLLEISFGVYEGYSTINPDYPAPDHDFYFFFDDPGRYKAPEGGETIPELMARTGSFLDELAREKWQEDETFLIATHGAAYRALQAKIEHIDARNLWQNGVPGNCAVSVAELQNGVWKLIKKDVLYAK